MPAHRLMPPDRHIVVLGPCPGCSIWTLEYDDAIAASYEDWPAAVESVLAGHLDECPGLRELLS